MLCPAPVGRSPLQLFAHRVMPRFLTAASDEAQGHSRLLKASAGVLALLSAILLAWHALGSGRTTFYVQRSRPTLEIEANISWWQSKQCPPCADACNASLASMAAPTPATPPQPAPAPAPQPQPQPQSSPRSSNRSSSGGSSSGGSSGGSSSSRGGFPAMVAAQLEAAYGYVPPPTNYTPALPEAQLQKGMVSYGDLSRTRQLIHKLLRGEAITAVYIGGSITWGQGASRQGVTDHAALTLDWIRREFPRANHTLLNRAIPATPTTYMARCLSWHVPEDADLVVLEYNINDGPSRFDEPVRRAHERLVRKLLELPRRPAVIETVVYRWATLEMPTFQIPYRYHGDDEIGVIAQYYHLPWMALRSLMWDAVFSDPHLNQSEPQPFFMADADHPNDLGHRYLSDLVVGYMRRAMIDLALTPYSNADEEMCQEPLPPPMLRDNWPTKANACIMGQLFKERAVEAKGFDWVNEGTETKQKFGWVGLAPGAKLIFEIDTAIAAAQQDGALTPVGIVHLRSYEHMGKALFSCVSGCNCTPYLLNGHTGNPALGSQQSFDAWEVSRAERCVIEGRILNETDSGEHKVKVTGVVISEGSGARSDLQAGVLGVDYNADGTAAFAG